MRVVRVFMLATRSYQIVLGYDGNGLIKTVAWRWQ